LLYTDANSAELDFLEREDVNLSQINFTELQMQIPTPPKCNPKLLEGYGHQKD
jgi:hypothetical protein